MARRRRQADDSGMNDQAVLALLSTMLANQGRLEETRLASESAERIATTQAGSNERIANLDAESKERMAKLLGMNQIEVQKLQNEGRVNEANAIGTQNRLFQKQQHVLSMQAGLTARIMDAMDTLDPSGRVDTTRTTMLSEAADAMAARLASAETAKQLMTAIANKQTYEQWANQVSSAAMQLTKDQERLLSIHQNNGLIGASIMKSVENRLAQMKPEDVNPATTRALFSEAADAVLPPGSGETKRLIDEALFSGKEARADWLKGMLQSPDAADVLAGITGGIASKTAGLAEVQEGPAKGILSDIASRASLINSTLQVQQLSKLSTTTAALSVLNPILATNKPGEIINVDALRNVMVEANRAAGVGPEDFVREMTKDNPSIPAKAMYDKMSLYYSQSPDRMAAALDKVQSYADSLATAQSERMPEARRRLDESTNVFMMTKLGVLGKMLANTEDPSVFLKSLPEIESMLHNPAYQSGLSPALMKDIMGTAQVLQQKKQQASGALAAQSQQQQVPEMLKRMPDLPLTATQPPPNFVEMGNRMGLFGQRPPPTSQPTTQPAEFGPNAGPPGGMPKGFNWGFTNNPWSAGEQDPSNPNKYWASGASFDLRAYGGDRAAMMKDMTAYVKNKGEFVKEYQKAMATDKPYGIPSGIHPQITPLAQPGAVFDPYGTMNTNPSPEELRKFVGWAVKAGLINPAEGESFAQKASKISGGE